MAEAMKRYNFLAPEANGDRVIELAEANGENLSVVLRRALIAYIKENEEVYTAESVPSDQEPAFIPDGKGGGHFRIPRGLRFTGDGSSNVVGDGSLNVTGDQS